MCVIKLKRNYLMTGYSSVSYILCHLPKRNYVSGEKSLKQNKKILFFKYLTDWIKDVCKSRIKFAKHAHYLSFSSLYKYTKKIKM